MPDAPIPNLGPRRRRAILADGYVNEPMTRADAERIRDELGLLISEHDANGRAIPRTARVELRPREKGYDLLVPAELFRRLYMAGYTDGFRTGRPDRE